MSAYFDFIDKKKLNTRLTSGSFPFNKYLFWDSKPEEIDIQINKAYIIERVLTRGKLEDFYMLLQLYKTDEIKQALTKSKNLDPKTLQFCSLFFNIPKSELYVSSFYS